MTRTRTVLQAVGLAGCLSALGVASLTFGASCIIPDKGIVVHERGYSWCTRANDARAWTHPDFTTPVTGNDNEPVKGCICLDNEEDNDFLNQWVGMGGPPVGHVDFNDYDLLRDQILLAARVACEEEAEKIGEFNDCEEVLTDANLLFADGRSDECRLEALYADTDTSAPPPDPNPYDLSGLSCSAGVCTAPQSLIDDMLARPSAFALDSTRLEFTKTGIFFRTVDRGDAAYIAGIRSGDELISIEGNAINDIGDIADALVDLANSTSATAKLKDSNGANVTIQLSVL